MTTINIIVNLKKIIMIKVKNNRQYHSSLKTSKLEKKKKELFKSKVFILFYWCVGSKALEKGSLHK